MVGQVLGAATALVDAVVFAMAVTAVYNSPIDFRS